MENQLTKSSEGLAGADRSGKDQETKRAGWTGMLLPSTALVVP